MCNLQTASLSLFLFTTHGWNDGKRSFFFSWFVCFFFLSMCLFILLILFESSSPLFVFFWLIGLASSDEAGGCLWNTKKKKCNLIFEAGRGVQKDERKKPQHLWRPDSIGAEGFLCAFACVFVLINEYYSESRVCRGFRGRVAPPPLHLHYIHLTVPDVFRNLSRWVSWAVIKKTKKKKVLRVHI